MKQSRTGNHRGWPPCGCGWQFSAIALGLIALVVVVIVVVIVVIVVVIVVVVVVIVVGAAGGQFLQTLGKVTQALVGDPLDVLEPAPEILLDILEALGDTPLEVLDAFSNPLFQRAEFTLYPLAEFFRALAGMPVEFSKFPLENFKALFHCAQALLRPFTHFRDIHVGERCPSCGPACVRGRGRGRARLCVTFPARTIAFLRSTTFPLARTPAQQSADTPTQRVGLVMQSRCMQMLDCLPQVVHALFIAGIAAFALTLLARLGGTLPAPFFARALAVRSFPAWALLALGARAFGVFLRLDGQVGPGGKGKRKGGDRQTS